jgi:excisionase family DNA binding protein
VPNSSVHLHVNAHKEKPLERLLRVAEAAARLAISRTTLYQMMGAGELRAVHIGRSVRIPEAELDRFIRDQYRASDRVPV